MQHILREAEEWFGGGFDDDLPRETPFQKQVGTSRLWSSRHDHETVQMVVLRIVRGESRLAPRVIGDIDEAHNLDSMYFRARGLIAESAARKEQDMGVPLLGQGNGKGLAGSFIRSVETQDRIDALWRVRRRPDEEDGGEGKKHNHDEHECRQQWMSTGEPRSARGGPDHFAVSRRTIDSALASPWTNGRNTDKYVVGDERDGELHGQEYGDRICRLTPRQEPQVPDAENERREDDKPKKEPAGRGAEPCHDPPRGTRNDDSDHGQRRVVGELEICLPSGRRDQDRTDGNEDGVDEERSTYGRHH